MIKLSDYLVDFLVKNDIHDIFLVSGGGMMHLLDSVGKNKKMHYISNHHEQASATAAESYARMTNHISACLVTTGPGGTNAITGVAGAFVDSIPMIVISGQVKTEVIADYTKLRQIGPQEIDIVSIAKPVTKYAVTIKDPQKIRYELEKCFYLATSGRPGPVWLDVPLDVQGTIIDEKKLTGFTPKAKITNNAVVKQFVKETINALNHSKRPVLIAGNGVRLAHAQELLREFLKVAPMPVLLPFGGMDLIGEDEHFFVGKFGPGGQRRGNFVLQNSDLILSIGANLNIASVGFEYQGFAPLAKKIVVNIDKEELKKKSLPVKKDDLLVPSDAKAFLTEFLKQTKKRKFKFSKSWYDACEQWKKNYPSVEKEFFTNTSTFKDKNHVNSYLFFETLSKLLKSNDVITTGIGLDASSIYQAFQFKRGQRGYVNKNFGQMGWGLPGAIGASVGNKRKPTICVTGDGDIQVNIHELGTIAINNLPIKLFVFSNGLYESIRATQNNLFDGRIVGADKTSGVSSPDFKLLAKAYGIPYETIKSNDELTKKMKKILSYKSPVLCEVNISYHQKRIPKVASYMTPDGKMHSKPLEDMFPFLPEKEVWENMHLFDK
jgi:acetolactate synthase-1/2/3 large subunit